MQIIVGLPPGSATDIVARLVGQGLSERLGQPVVIENRPGASTNIGTEVVVRAPADGYTLLLITSINAINTSLYEHLNFNFIRDVVPVARIGATLFVMVVNPSVPAKTVPEFIAYAKANPGRISMASAGNGSGNHVYGELFKAMTGVDMIHVPYRSTYMPDLLGGRVQVVFTTMAQCIEYIKDGRLRALAVTGSARSETLPDIPTVGESVPGYEASGWQGIGAPKSTPNGVIEKLNREVNAVVVALEHIEARGNLLLLAPDHAWRVRLLLRDTGERLADGFKLDIGNPVALAPVQARLLIFALEGCRRALEQRRLYVLKRIDADDGIQAAVDSASDHRHHATGGAHVKLGSLGTERVC